MNKLIPSIILLLVVVSCAKNDQETPAPTDFGYLSLNISVSITAKLASGRVAAILTDDWKVTIFDATDDSEIMVFDPYSTAPSEVQLPTGEYYIEAHSNNFQEAAFENPYYFGRSVNFTIDKEELKTISIDAELTNSKVAINYSSNLTSTFNDYTGAITVVSTGTTLVYGQGETREGYFVSEPLSVVVDLSYTKLDGTFITRQFTANIDAQPKTLYNVNVDASLEDGKIVININVDETFTEEVIELGDMVIDPNINDNWSPGDDWVDIRDGEVYRTTQIGNQVWMSENLRATQYTDGTEVPLIQNADDWAVLSTPGYSWYNDNSENSSPKGAYYNYFVIESGNVCPAGWRVPEYFEWETLGNNIQAENNDPEGNLKAPFSWDNGLNGTDLYSFTAVAAGWRRSRTSGEFANVGELAYWWVAPNSEFLSNFPYTSGITNFGFFPYGDFDDQIGINIRCIKDINEPVGEVESVTGLDEAIISLSGFTELQYVDIEVVANANTGNSNTTGTVTALLYIDLSPNVACSTTISGTFNIGATCTYRLLVEPGKSYIIRGAQANSLATIVNTILTVTQ